MSEHRSELAVAFVPLDGLLPDGSRVEPYELDWVVNAQRGQLPAPVDPMGRPVCLSCLENVRERKYGLRGRAEGYRRWCSTCRKRSARYSGPDVVGSRDFPCERHGWTRCSLCPRDPTWEVAEDRLSVLPLYRLGMGDQPYGKLGTSFFKRHAVELYGASAVQRAWTAGLTAMQADVWATRLVGHLPSEIWPRWDALMDREAAEAEAKSVRGAARSRRRRPRT